MRILKKGSLIVFTRTLIHSSLFAWSFLLLSYFAKYITDLTHNLEISGRIDVSQAPERYNMKKKRKKENVTQNEEKNPLNLIL